MSSGAERNKGGHASSSAGHGGSGHNPSLALPVGMAVGEYRLEDVLGANAFGIAYLASDAQARKVVLKEYFPADLAVRDGAAVRAISPAGEDPLRRGRDRFLSDARRLQRIHHAAIVAVHKVFEAHNTAYMAVEHEPGETLEAALAGKNNDFDDEARLRRFALALVDGLEAVHSSAFLHGKVEPSNIRLRDGAPVLLDFGTARAALALNVRAGVLRLTPGYAAIEQYTSHEAQGPWTDLYGLAATLYRVVAGKDPLDAPARLLEDRLVPAIDMGGGRYSRTFLKAIDAALVVRPEDRPQTIAEWRPMLDPVLAPRAFAARQSAPVDDDGDDDDYPVQARRFPLWGYGAIAAGVLVGAFAIAAATSSLFTPSRIASDRMPPGYADRLAERAPARSGVTLAVPPTEDSAAAQAREDRQRELERQAAEQIRADQQRLMAEQQRPDQQRQAQIEEARQREAQQREVQQREARQREEQQRQAAEQQRLAAERAEQQRQQQLAAARAAEEARQREAQQREAARLQEVARQQEQARQEQERQQAAARSAEEARQRETARQQEIARQQEAARQQEQARQEQARQEQERQQAAARAAEETRLREEARAREEARSREEARIRDETRAREEARNRQEALAREQQRAREEADRAAAQATAAQAAGSAAQPTTTGSPAPEAGGSPSAALAPPPAGAAPLVLTPSIPVAPSAPPRSLAPPAPPGLVTRSPAPTLTARPDAPATNGNNQLAAAAAPAARAASDVGRIEDVNWRWGYLVLQAERTGLQVGDRVYARAGDQKLWMTIRRVSGAQVSAVPDSDLQRYPSNGRVYRD